jgi:hypothetical protein
MPPYSISAKPLEGIEATSKYSTFGLALDRRIRLNALAGGHYSHSQS